MLILDYKVLSFKGQQKAKIQNKNTTLFLYWDLEKHSPRLPIPPPKGENSLMTPSTGLGIYRLLRPPRLGQALVGRKVILEAHSSLQPFLTSSLLRQHLH